MKLSSFSLFGKTFRSPPLRSLSRCKIGSHVLDSWYYVEKYQRKRVAYYCYQKLILGRLIFQEKLRQMFLNWMLQNKEFNPENLTLWQSPSSNMLQSKSFMEEITGNIVHKSPRRNIHKLFDCIRTSLKSFLTCLTFHRKEYDFVICIRGRTVEPARITFPQITQKILLKTYFTDWTDH